MAFDLSWLWDLLRGIADTIKDFFEGIWDVVEPIVNTGQGIFAGLVAFGSQLWDAFIKGMNAFGEWLYKQFQWLYEGLKYWSDVFGQWFSIAMSWIGSGISWVAQQFYNFGNWLYNSWVYIYSWIVNTLIGLWEGLVTWFSGIASGISSWWASVIAGINTWFTNLLKTFRQKIVTTIMADLTITGAWKGAERILAPKRLSDIGYGLVGVIASPIIGRVVGEIVNAVVPMPSSATYPLIPDITAFTYTPPSLAVVKPTEPTPPSLGAPPSPPTWGYGLPLDKSLYEQTAYDLTTSTKDKEAKDLLAYDVTTDSKDAEVTETVSYETEVT